MSTNSLRFRRPTNVFMYRSRCWDTRGTVDLCSISHVTDAFHGLDLPFHLYRILTFACFSSSDPFVPRYSGAVENCVALSVCNLPVLVPALASREERDKYEGTRTGFSFGRDTTYLSTLNTISMHVEPDQGYEEPVFKAQERPDFHESICSDGSALRLSDRGEYGSPRKEHPL